MFLYFRSQRTDISIYRQTVSKHNCSSTKRRRHGDHEWTTRVHCVATTFKTLCKRPFFMFYRPSMSRSQMIHYKINTSTDRKVDHDRFLVYLKFYLINRLPLKWYFKLDLVIMVPDLVFPIGLLKKYYLN